MTQNDKLVNVKDIIRQEMTRCKSDPAYFIKKYCFIQHPKRGRIPFALYNYQEKAVQDFESNNYNIILKGRQIGISTVVACYSLWMMLFYKDRNVLVIATKQDVAKNMISKVRFAYDHLPIWLQVKCTENNKLSLKFKNGSQIKAATAADDSGRSEALSLLILDEAAFIRNAKEIWVAALPTLSTGGQAILISTPNGVGNFFHKMYTDATAGLIENVEEGKLVHFNAIKLDWRVHPERDENWRKQMGLMQGEREARQEYDAEFIGSGATVIDADLIEYYANTTVMPPIQKMGLDGNVWIWEIPDYNKQYILVADVARGDGSDYSAFHIIDLETCAQVVEYKGKLDTTEFAHDLITWATKYNDALLVVERENVGWAVLQIIIDRGYKNLFYMSKDRQVVEVEKNLSNRYWSEEKKMVPGFGTSLKTRPLIISKLDTYIRDVLLSPEQATFSVIIRSSRLIDELRVFIWHPNGKAEAMEGYNDDLIMSLGIALWIRDTALRLHQEGIELTKAAIDRFKRSTVEVEGLYSPNHLLYDPYKINVGNPNVQNDPSGDLRWLLG